MAEKTPPAKKFDGVSTHCILCGHHLKKDCRCPWIRPFEKWPSGTLCKLQDLVDGGPRPGS